MTDYDEMTQQRDRLISQCRSLEAELAIARGQRRMNMITVIHEEIETPFNIAMKCAHLPDADHICWNCTIKIIDLAEHAENEFTAAHAEVERLRTAMMRLLNAAEVYSADQSSATDSRCGLVQPITVSDGEELNAAIKIARAALKLQPGAAGNGE